MWVELGVCFLPRSKGFSQGFVSPQKPTFDPEKVDEPQTRGGSTVKIQFNVSLSNFKESNVQFPKLCNVLCNN